MLETNGPEMEALYREAAARRVPQPAASADLPPAAFPKHRHYVADRFNFFTIGYNTRLVKPDEVPNSYDDLLHPRFVGRIGLEAGDVDWFGAMVKHMGEEKGLAFFRKLAAAKPQIRSGHTLMGQLVASGEIPLAANIYNHNAERVAVQGAPIQLEGARRRRSGGPTRSASPGARRTRTRRCCSPISCSRAKGRRSSRSGTACRRAARSNSHLNAFPFEMIDPVITLDEDAKWSKMWSELFLKGQRVQRDVD